MVLSLAFLLVIFYLLGHYYYYYYYGSGYSGLGCHPALIVVVSK